MESQSRNCRATAEQINNVSCPRFIYLREDGEGEDRLKTKAKRITKLEG